MKKSIALICAVFIAAQALFAQDAGAPKAPSVGDVNRIVERSVALVAFKFKAAVPGKAYMSFAGEWCHNCGRTHSKNINEFLREDKSFFTVGFYTAEDEVMIQDFAIPPEYIASITVDGDRSAEIVKIKPDRAAAMLKIVKTDAEYLDKTFLFTGGTPAFAAVPNLQAIKNNALFYWEKPAILDGDECVVSKIIPINPGTRFDSPVILLDKDGKPAGITFDSYPIPLDMDWGSEVSLTPAELAGLEALAIENAARYSVPVTLKFRSPPKPTGQQAQRSRYSWDDDETGMEITEFETLAYRVSDTRLLILSGDEHIWRLSSITAKFGDKNVPAKFVHSLRHASFIIADMEKGDAPEFGREFYSVKNENDMPVPVFAISTVDAGGGKLEFSAARGMLRKATPGWRDLPCHDSIVEHYESGTDNSERPDLVFPFGINESPVAWLVAYESGKESIGERYSYNRGGTALLDIETIDKFTNPEPAEIKQTVKPLIGVDRKPKGSFGLDLQPMTGELAKNRAILRLTNGGRAGAIVSAVTPGSPAAEAGIEENWVLLSIIPEGSRIPVTISLDGDSYDFGNDFPWERLDEIPEQYFSQIPAPWKAPSSALDTALGGFGVGTKVDAAFILPGGTVETKTLTIAEAPPTYETAPFHNWREAGITLCALTHEVRTYLGLDPDAPGLVVRGARGGTPAVKAGLRPMELVTHINNEPLTSLDDFKRLATAKGAFTLNVTRLDKSRLVVFELK
ncbi:MAG: hypothetical protein FWG05_00550 [Kiritimatiellaeota bacterium]|nr:hypothetical protein [Kiritimatiellota bacterium]